MRICLITSALLALAAPVASAPVQDPCEDEDNVFTAPASGSKLFTDTWAEGGPSSWGGGTAVYGGICFDVSGSSGTVIVDGIDRDYTNITGLHTSDSADPTTLVLEGSGSLSFYNGGEQITIEPRVGLTLSVETIFNGDVHLNTQYMMTSQGEQMTIEDSMTLTQANAALTISGPSYVQFTNDATLSMDGTSVVGQQAGNRLIHRFCHAKMILLNVAMSVPLQISRPPSGNHNRKANSIFHEAPCQQTPTSVIIGVLRADSFGFRRCF